MAYVAPNSDLWLCRGVPLDSDYHYSYRPASASAQQTAILAYTAYTLTNQSYIRHTNNTIRVAIAPDDALGCNYMAFRNTSFGNKMFYAFITDVEYVNNETSLITYSIDVLQTYFFDVNILPSYIEREHSASDAIGDSITPESATVNRYVTNYETPLNPDGQSLTNMALVLMTTKSFKNPSQPATRVFYRGIARPYGYVSDAEYTVFNTISASADINQISQQIDNYVNGNGSGSGGIAAAYLAPLWLFSGWDATYPYIAYNAYLSTKKSLINVPRVLPSDTLDGYKPLNNKLYTYPYNYFEIQSPEGQSQSIQYECWSSSDGVRNQLVCEGTALAGNGAVRIYPKDYNGTTDPNVCSVNLTVDVNPAFSTSALQEWQSAQNLTASANCLVSLINLVKKFNVLGSVSTASDLIQKSQDVSFASSPVQNVLTSASEDYDFVGRRKSVDASTAKQIDDYFTMYGYAVNRCKVPNFTQSTRRPSYNFCKTRYANITPKSDGVPADAVSNIVKIFDNGVCLWETLANTGKYILSNAPVT